MARKLIKRKSAVKPITGSIVDTTNIDNKAKNTYSAGIIDGLVGAKQDELTAGTNITIADNVISAKDTFSSHITWRGGGTSETIQFTFASSYAFALIITNNGGLYMVTVNTGSVSVSKISDKSDLTITFVADKKINIKNTDYTRFSIITATNYSMKDV